MMPLVREFFARGLLPEHFAVLAIETQNHELISFRGRLSASASAPFGWVSSWRGRGWSFGRRFDPFTCGDGRLDEHAVIPNDRSRHALTRNLRLPLDVVGLAPDDGRICFGRDSGGERAAPLRPVLLDGGGSRQRRLKAEPCRRSQ
jgi:hypothetical protein